MSVAGSQPPLLFPSYRATTRRAPAQPLVVVPGRLADLEAPVYEWWSVDAADHDLTQQHDGQPQGQRIVVSGRVLEEDGRPAAGALVEIWQANAAGRYRHGNDTHPAPLDPNFSGGGRAITDADGRYRFVTIKPGAYPWRNHDNAWRPAHIHFSLFGSTFRTRLVTQMYFPDDPLHPFDPMLDSIRDQRARQRLIAQFDLNLTEPEWALGFAFDIVLRGANSTPFEGRI